ncbi:CDP-alcohol phosphatidyltransferase family protein [Halomonas sp. TBZ9]|uniref:CDP-alcohol phosphatidyltransferase family protein n=1 Tax=Vreelandella azerica TaxID=2732867 RepID=A0A7Y3TWJ3_9GAMM|nr:CDP-alcohol phosphatidyltransferase family protein [Halomonas azerica]NOG31581.1 CDP-alcohol phosphatidyltransferase family protein [Halomonas azerica]
MTIYRKAQRTGSYTAALFTLSEISLGALMLVVLGASLPQLLSSLLAWGLAFGLYTLIAGLVMAFWSGGPLGWANRVTLLRAVLVAIVAAGVWMPLSPLGHWQWLGVALIALLLDGVDGWVARRTGSQTAFGARFDMELDALLILLLCVGVMLKTPTGPWVLLIGAMRYAFVAAGTRYPWLQEALYDSLRRKAVCVWQIAALLLALTPWASGLAALLLALSALVVLVYSFGVDTLWLYRQYGPRRR